MIPRLIFAMLMLVVVLVGMLLMTQILSFEQLGTGISRLLLLVALVASAAFLLKLVVLPILICALVLLKSLALLGLAIVTVLIACVVILRLCLLKLANRNARPRRRNEEL